MDVVVFEASDELLQTLGAGLKELEGTDGLRVEFAHLGGIAVLLAYQKFSQRRPFSRAPKISKALHSHLVSGIIVGI